MAEKRRRSPDADLIFQGASVSPDLLPELFRKGKERMRHRDFRINTARGIRLKTTTVQLRPSWVRRHPEAAEWVVKVLPERRTLERDLIASVGAIEPAYARTAIGFLDRDKDHAQECTTYMETWRKNWVPYQTSIEKCAEDGEHGGVVLPTDVDMEGCPDFYDRLSAAAYDALDDDERAAYRPDDDDPKGRYARFDDDGSKRPNPAYDRDAAGRPRTKDAAAFSRDDAKSKEAHDAAVERYLLQQEQGGVTVRVIPASDCVPFLTPGTRRDRWKLLALVERTLYYPEELISKGYGWRGMGDAALLPSGVDPTRDSGQNGMWYLYTLYMTWADPEDRRRGRRPIERPIICYSVGGNPTWSDGEPDGSDKRLPDNGVAVIDLYETHGLEGAYWWYGGGLHTSDGDPDFYWEPYLWPLSETILGIEGMQTMANAATAVQGSMGYFHKPDANLLGEGKFDAEDLLEEDGSLMVPKLPDAGEIETTAGDISPATPAQVSPDVWRVIAGEYDSLRANTALELPGGAGSQPSGHAMVVKETIGLTAKRHIREGAKDFVKFCGERAMRIFAAIEREYDVAWPLQTSQERPVGSEIRAAFDPLVWNSAWVGDGEYQLRAEYPDEYNPVKVETAMNKIQAGVGSLDELVEASGKTDTMTELSKIMQTKIWLSEPYAMMMTTRLAKRTGNKLMLQVLRLQQQQKMTTSGPPGFDAGIPSAVLNGPGGGGGTGGPSTAERSLGGQMAAAVGPAMQDAAATAQIPGAA